jgi:hypothetical protein
LNSRRSGTFHVIKRALHLRIAFQNCCEQQAVAAADVYHGMDAFEVVGVGYGWAVDRGQPRHGLVENVGFLAIFLEELEDVFAVDRVDGLPAGSDAPGKVCPAATVPFPAEHSGAATQAGTRVLAQDRGHGRLRKRSVRALYEDSHGGRGTHEAVQRVGFRADFGPLSSRSGTPSSARAATAPAI